MRREDLARVREIATGLKDAPQWPETVYAQALEPGGVRRVALVAQDEARVVGFAVASVVGATAELETLGVTETSQRGGVGTMLMEALKGEVLGAGAEELLLEVRAGNERALGLYRRMGFVEAGRRKGYYAEPVEDAVLLRLLVRKAEG